MARGSQAKDQITRQILENFSGSFINEKEIRIPWIEDGEELQVKVTLTCAKVNVPNPNAGSVVNINSENTDTENTTSDANFIPELTEDEKNKVNDLIKKLQL